MPTIPGILKDVLAGITPGTAEEPVLAEVDRFLTRLKLELSTRRINAKPILGGSFAKDTWLKGDYDVDVFVAFDLKHREQDLSDLLAKALKPWKVDRVHGSRDYFQIKGRINYEIIPVLDIRKSIQAQNVTDFSPKHVAWVNTKGKRLKDDIRLLKQFCKAQRVYGAESYIRGFSGHVVDILVIYYGGFVPLLRAAKAWKDKLVLDYNKVYKGKALYVLNESKIQGPLVLIDPVQPDRNAAAALTQENFDRFIAAAKRFLAMPSRTFFEEKDPDLHALQKKGAILVDIHTVQEKEDVAGTKLVKAFQWLKTQLENAEFHVADAGWAWERKKHATCWYRTRETQLPKTMQRHGPPARLQKNAADFRKKYRAVKVVKGRLVATVPREFRTPLAVLRHALKDAYLKDKAVSVRLR